MAKLSILLPSRDERFLLPTIHDIFRNAKGEVEVVAVIDSNLWPEGWKEITAQYPNLHTIFHGEPRGMRAAINSGAASAISRGAKYLAKFDAHCSFSEGFDEVLKADCDDDWIVVPRRGRLDPEQWCETELHKPPIDYHYLSFPDDPNDFGGPGLNGKVWDARAKERKDVLLDEEMSSQGSGWFMQADYFTRLELMDQANYGPFWNEFQELGLKCWLSGGKVMVNKKAKYLHLHKGKKYGRGYTLPESWLQQGRTYAARWAYNDAWPKQTLPFEWLIDHFWPVPSWPNNWREVLYATRKPRLVGASAGDSDFHSSSSTGIRDNDRDETGPVSSGGLVIHSAVYGYDDEHKIDVAEQVRALVKGDSLDIVVNNSTLTPNQNPFRGKRKVLSVQYSFDGGEKVLIQKYEKDWLIIGPVGERFAVPPKSRVEGDDVLTRLRCVQCGLLTDSLMAPIAEANEGVCSDKCADKWIAERGTEPIRLLPAIAAPMTAAALNDYLIRKFNISPQRLRGPMPIELRDFHRDDLAQLFAELGFKRGAEIGVAEGKYSEVLLKANPDCELLLVDPWHAYSDNPQNKSKAKDDFAYQETLRRTKDYPNVKVHIAYSMDAVREVKHDSLDFAYIDGHHSYPYVMCDIIEWAKRVRSGGIVAGDDIYRLDEKRWGAGPMEAIYDYTRAMRIGLWWLINAHKSVDFFFVKP